MATDEQKRKAIRLAYSIVTDKRNSDKYAFTAITNRETMSDSGMTIWSKRLKPCTTNWTEVRIMVDQFYSRKKTCRFQGRIKHGLTICKKDGSVRHAAKCNCYDCPRWNRTPWKAFLWWLDYGTLVYSWKDLVENWKQRWKSDGNLL